MQTGLIHTPSNPECCVKPGRMLLDYSLSSHCVCYWGPSYTIAQLMVISDLGLGWRTERSPGNRGVRASALSTVTSQSHEENKAVKNVIHSCTVHIELSELGHWKLFPSSHSGQLFPSFPHGTFTDRKGQGQQGAFLWNRGIVSRGD